MRWLREVPALGILQLRKGGLRRCSRACGNRNIRAPHFSEQAVEELGPHFRIAKSGGDPEDLEFRAAQGQSYGKSIVNIVANVRINDDLFFGSWLKHSRAGARREATGRTRKHHTGQEKNEDSARVGHVRLLTAIWMVHVCRPSGSTNDYSHRGRRDSRI